MSDQITAAQFHACDGVEDWRVLATSVAARFAICSLEEGALLVSQVARLGAGHACGTEVDMRPASVTVRLPFKDTGSPTGAHAALARAISVEARGLGLGAGDNPVQEVHLAIDAMSLPMVMPFWKAVLGYVSLGEEDLFDPEAAGPWIWFQQMDAPRPQRNRLHVDVYVPLELAPARIDAALAAGGRLVTSEHAPSWWVLADPEGNEACVATCMEFEGAS